MRIVEVKKAISLAASKVDFNDWIDSAMTCTVLYKFIQSVIANNDSEANNLKSLADSYVKLYRDKIMQLNGSYISYKMMRTIIVNSGKQSFLAFSESLIDKIYEAYLNTAKIELFSPIYYSQYMYQVMNINFKQNERLTKIHYEIMCPIAKYYKQKYGISYKNLQIVSADGVDNNPGKEIVFMIEGVNSTKIMIDILSKRINVNVYTVTLVDDYVRLVTQ